MPPQRRDIPLLSKQWVAVIDERTTFVCLDVAGDIVDLDEPFETLTGDWMTPPAHIHCRATVIPWLPGMVNTQRQLANAEIRRRPAKQRRRGPGGYAGRIPPPAV